MRLLGEKKAGEFMEMYKVEGGGVSPTKSVSPPGKKCLVGSPAKVTNQVGRAPIPEAFDAHFYLDKGWKQWGGRGRPVLREFVGYVLPTRPLRPLNLVGGVVTYSDPDGWPTPREVG